MTKDEIEAVWADVYRMYEQSNANIYPAAIQRLREPFDIALSQYVEIGYLLKNDYGFVSAHVPDLPALPKGRTTVFISGEGAK